MFFVILVALGGGSPGMKKREVMKAFISYRQPFFFEKIQVHVVLTSHQPVTKNQNVFVLIFVVVTIQKKK